MSQSPFNPEQITLLEQPLDRSRVKHRQGGGGTQLAYLKGHDVIDTANRIFGYGNWGYDLMGVELINITGDNGEVVGSYYAARLRLTVAGCVPVTEEGACPVQEGRNPRAKIDAHDMARKGAITDALKRALRCYGDQFGNSLYDTDLVDGQPRQAPNAARTSNGARPVQAAPAQEPVAARPAPARVSPPETRPAPAAAPSPVPVAPAAASTPGTGEGATERQRQAILRLAQQKQINPRDLEMRLQSLYGCSLNDLSQGDAGHFIKELQNNAA